MKSKDKVILIKIQKYIEDISEFIKGYSKEQFYNDKKTINACVFCLGQIGELAGKATQELIETNPRNRMERYKSIKK